MHNRRNYYRLLHVQPEAPSAVIQASYRAMMQKCKMHPDLGGNTEVAALLNQAYQTLSCPQQRTAYDQTLSAQQKTGQASGISCLFCGETDNEPGQVACDSCHAPLTPVQSITHTANGDKRALPRYPHQAIIYYSSDPLFPLRQSPCLDLTPTGMRFLTPESLEINSIVKVESAVLNAAARVAHCEPHTTANSHQIGVEFKTVAFINATRQFVNQRV